MQNLVQTTDLSGQIGAESKCTSKCVAGKVVVEFLRRSAKVGVTHLLDNFDARTARAMMTPTNSVPTPAMTRLRLRHQVAFWKALSSAGATACANCCSTSAWLGVGVSTWLGSKGNGRKAAIIHAGFPISFGLHAHDGGRGRHLPGGNRNPRQKSRICLF